VCTYFAQKSVSGITSKSSFAEEFTSLSLRIPPANPQGDYPLQDERGSFSIVQSGSFVSP